MDLNGCLQIIRQLSETRERLHVNSGGQSSILRLGIAFYFEALQNDAQVKSGLDTLLSLENQQQLHPQLVEELHFYAKLARAAYANTPEEAYQRSGVPDQYIVHSQWNSTSETPAHVLYYRNCIAYICIRGTKQFEDVLRALSCSSDQLLHGRGHSGAVRAANALLVSMLPNLESLQLTHIFVAGHSFGGAVGSLLVLLLKERSEVFQNVHIEGFAFCPPPVIGAELLPASVECITTVVHGQDMVPSLDPKTLDELLIQLSTGEWERAASLYLESGASNYLPRPVAAWTGAALSGWGSYFVNRFEASNNPTVSSRSSDIQVEQDHVEQFLAGRVLHLTHAQGSHPRLLERSAHEFTSIKPSLWALYDHNMENILESIVNLPQRDPTA